MPRPAFWTISKEVSVRKDQGHGTKTGGLNMQPHNSLMWWILPPCPPPKKINFFHLLSLRPISLVLTMDFQKVHMWSNPNNGWKNNKNQWIKAYISNDNKSWLLKKCHMRSKDKCKWISDYWVLFCIFISLSLNATVSCCNWSSPWTLLLKS